MPTGVRIAMALVGVAITVPTVVAGQPAWWVFFLAGTVVVGGIALAGLDSRAKGRRADAFAARHGYPVTPALLEWSGIEIRPMSAWLPLIATHPTWEQRLAAANSKVALSFDADLSNRKDTVTRRRSYNAVLYGDRVAWSTDPRADAR